MTTALELRWALRRLRQQYRLQAEPRILPHAAPSASPMILTGYASTGDLDADRMVLLPYSIELPSDPRSVRLYLRHDTSHGVVGQVQELGYDHAGNLTARVRVEDQLARRMPSFSVGVRVVQAELVDADGPTFRGIVRRAILDELTLTDRPANPHALVRERYPSVHTDFCDAAIKALEIFGRAVQIIGSIQHAR